MWAYAELVISLNYIIVLIGSVRIKLPKRNRFIPYTFGREKIQTNKLGNFEPKNMIRYAT